MTGDLQVYRGRVRLKREMQRALSCLTPGAKKRLAAEWKEIYSQVAYDELIRCAKNKDAALTISEWDIPPPPTEESC